MLILAIINAIVIVFIGLIEWFVPSLLRPDNLFSITVAPGTRQRPEGRALMRQWRTISVIKNVAFLALALGLTLTSDMLPAIIASATIPIVVTLSEGILYVVFHQRARAFAVPTTGEVRAATLKRRSYLEMVPLWWELGPLLIIGATIDILAYLYPQLPARYPIHWDFNGVANGFATKSIGSAFLFVWLQIGLAIFLTLLGIATTAARMKSTGTRDIMRQAIARILYVVKVAILFLFGYTAIVTAVSGIQQTQPGIWIFVGPLAVLLFILIVTAVMIIRLGQSGWRISNDPSITGDNMPDSAWKLGIIYYNPADPAWLVEQRAGIGMTFNFARPLSWLVLIGILVLATAISVVAVLFTKR